MKRYILLGIGSIVILASLMAGCNDENGGGGEEELETAPDFTLTSIDGDEFSLSDYYGKVVVLDFMFVTPFITTGYRFGSGFVFPHRLDLNFDC